MSKEQRSLTLVFSLKMENGAVIECRWADKLNFYGFPMGELNVCGELESVRVEWSDGQTETLVPKDDKHYGQLYVSEVTHYISFPFGVRLFTGQSLVNLVPRSGGGMYH